MTAPTKTQPGAQVIDPSTGTLYIANKSSGNVTVDSEGSSGNPSSVGECRLGPDRVLSRRGGPRHLGREGVRGQCRVQFADRLLDRDL